MSVDLVGDLTVGQLNVTLASQVGTASANLTAELDASVSITAGLNASIANPAASIAGAVAFVASGAAALTLASTTPASIVASASAGVSVQAGIQASLAAQLASLAAIPLGVGGLYTYAVDSTAGALGGDVDAAIGGGLPDLTGPAQRVQGVLILTDSPAALAALQSVLGF